ncbi:MAG: hypothetical protein A3A80_03335 [Candidatus Terrybacteria bacterium RIFCSPLOWO2_01_FULL_44_24]|uniref:Uncharacterized protein n=1 Tax=Candidatus Terrybacteria bacterium RIFCSPHIGHO2_01_FULL_43_35 TaxID=1802361 RepID=A0A1G2PDE8_9BACT|nr:MAG: hypothetical protein A2828_00250 [Candidatus Terrybacteria bacterium RIFCSPHIGHO2_01_FULL_43_35]OHA49721.1 MAG: hypothetical protein A3B75_01830 [Candidatus Terrybacteria bacterium RIFCSPHIGHO2_02_FULL_43_14]OHA51544.1 MAG: hypothetical protein A3A80_03335 [Candidatus Terrybacteria bacterium RIFCSPLOWO2_01_FULL_44_24]
MYSILAPLLFLLGLAGVILIVARALPILSELPEQENGKQGLFIVNKIHELIQKIPWQRWLFNGIEIILKKVRITLFAGLKKSERMVHSVQTRSQKFSPEKSIDVLPKFFDRIKKRKAFLEEERKLLEYIAHHHDDGASYKRLGNLYIIAGNVKDARAALEQATRLLPDDEDIMQKLEELS